MISPGAGCEARFSNPTGSLSSPNGIQQPSPLQRQWMSCELIGRRSRIAAHVSGASGSQRAVKFRSPTRIDRSVMARSVSSRASNARGATSNRGSPMDDQATISTHVLDTENGAPASGIEVALFRLNADGESEVGRETTDDDGRIRRLLSGALESGEYVIEFRLDGPFFGTVALTFRVED